MLKKSLTIMVLILILIQFIPLQKTNPKIDEKIALHTDKETMKMLKRSCYDCHSNETKWPVYSNIAPMSFEIVRHVNIGRNALNFSQYAKIDKKTKIKRLKRAVQTLKNSMMPLSSYTMFHSDATLSKKDKQILIAWFHSQLKTLCSNNTCRNY